MRNFRFNVYNLSGDPRLAGFSRQWAAQPSWVWRVAIIAGLLFVVMPMVVLVLVLGAAFAVTFGVVFALLVGANRLGRFFGDLGRRFQSRDDGRRNVRVIRHDESPRY